MDDLFHQVMKEWYWLVIFAALVAIAFAPSFLKGKCPRCAKRSLNSVEIDDYVRGEINSGLNQREFLTFYNCSACHSRFFRQRTGPFQDASAAEWQPVFSSSLSS